MFNYLYWPFDWGSEVATQLARVHSHVQITSAIAELEKMEAELFKLQNRGIHVELIVFLALSERGLRNMNTLKRMAIAGSNIALVSITESNQFVECFAILDKKQLVSNVDYGNVINIGELIYNKAKEFQVISSKSEKLDYSISDIHINLQVDKTEVQPGDMVELYWEVENADFIALDPVVGSINTRGNISVPLFEDTLFRIKASNKSGILIKSVFVKVVNDSFIELKISVYDPATTAYVTLESANPPHHSYAVLKGDRIKMEWSTKANGILKESKLGFINIFGEHIFQIFENENYIFTLETTLGVYNRKLDLFAISDQSSKLSLNPSEPIQKTKLPFLTNQLGSVENKLFKWFKRK
jgi:hypothetical protein